MSGVVPESHCCDITSADALVVAQAFHWMDPDVALTEFARVVRPGGVVGLVWNIRDDRVGWVRRLSEHLSNYGGTVERHDMRPFEPHHVELEVVREGDRYTIRVTPQAQEEPDDPDDSDADEYPGDDEERHSSASVETKNET